MTFREEALAAAREAKAQLKVAAGVSIGSAEEVYALHQAAVYAQLATAYATLCVSTETLSVSPAGL